MAIFHSYVCLPEPEGKLQFAVDLLAIEIVGFQGTIYWEKTGIWMEIPEMAMTNSLLLQMATEIVDFTHWQWWISKVM